MRNPRRPDANVATSKILVCGSNYGRAYIRAIRSMPDRCELVAILARGSDRSKRIAAEAAVPLLADPGEIPLDVDAACVAIPSSDERLILALLERGIHVLSDHPTNVRVLEEALPFAAERELSLHVNGHFSRLDAPQSFARACAHMRESVEPLFVDVFTTDRLLYATLDTLRHALSTLEPFSISARSPLSPVCVLQGTLASIPSVIMAQYAGDGQGIELKDGSPDYFLDMRIAVAFPMGVLTLLSLAGPVCWSWNFSRTMPLDEALPAENFHEGCSMPELKEQRARANRDAVCTLLKCASGGVLPAAQRPEHLLEVGRAWEAIGEGWAW